MFDFNAAREHMVDSQIRTNDVTDHKLIRAFRQIKRENFTPKSQQALAYTDLHIKMDSGRVIPKPRDLGKMIQAADIQPSEAVLDIACARGYSSAILAQLAETVIGLETSDEEVEKASKCLSAAGIDNVAVVKGDLKSGAAEHGPFNVIFVNGAVKSVPQAWLDQLADGGRLVVVTQSGPVGHARIFTRTGSHIGERIIFDTSMPILPECEQQAEFHF